MPILYVFADESRQCNERYMVLGGVILHSNSIDTYTKTMSSFRAKHNMRAEMKWSKVSNQKIDEYNVFVDHFFALANVNHINFRCLILDTHQFDHKKYNQGNKELGFYKFFYQLLYHCFCTAELSETNDVKIIIKLDERSSKYKLSDLKDILNRGIKKYMGITSNRIISIEPIDSKASDIMQINDIILGAIGYQKNGFDLIAGSKTAKIELAKYIASSAGISSLKDNTAWGITRFKIWNFKFKK